MNATGAEKIVYEPDESSLKQEVARLTLELEKARAELARTKDELKKFKQDPEHTFRDSLLLEVDKLTVSFNGFKALDNLSVYVNKDELHAIIGPNGAGKSTLLDAICGRTRPESGSILFKDRDLTKLKEHQIVRIGVGRKFQTPSIYEELTVFENLETSYPEKRDVLGSLFWKRKEDIIEKIRNIATLIFLEDKLNQKAGTLSHGQKQWLEIGMLLLQEHELLLLDEPVAGMSQSEREKTAQLLKDICRNRSVIVIEHDMNFVENIADRVTVLHQGKWLSEGSMEHVKNDPNVIEVYVGH